MALKKEQEDIYVKAQLVGSLEPYTHIKTVVYCGIKPLILYNPPPHLPKYNQPNKVNKGVL